MLHFVPHLGLVGYAAVAVSYAVATVLIVAAAPGRARLTWLSASLAVTALWALVVSLGLWAAGLVIHLAEPLELARSFVWIAFLWSLGRFPARAAVLTGLAVVMAALAGVPFVLPLQGASTSALVHLLVAPKLVVSVLGLVLVENIYRTIDRDQRWGIKYLCIAFGSQYAFDLYVYSEVLLTNSLDTQLFLVRSLVFLFILPPLMIGAYRAKLWQSELRLSHRGVFYTGALIGCGAYVAVMAGAGYYLREVGGTWGNAAQALFLFGALVLLVVLLLSGTARARVAMFVRQNFFRYKYDYRAEWLAFSARVAEANSLEPLEERIIKAVADLLESPASALWSRSGDQYVVTATWNMAVPSLGSLDADAVASLLQHRDGFVAIPQGSVEGPEAALPAVLSAIPGAWIVVPLLHHGDLVGFVLLSRPRAPHELGWEDNDLLRAVGRQAASYLAERQAASLIAEMQEFERFNQRSAFIVHDLKNLVSQLNLVASNIPRYGHDEAFRRDLGDTIGNVVSKMRELLARLTSDSPLQKEASEVVLAAVLRDLDVVGPDRVKLELAGDAGDTRIHADPERLASLFTHLIENATEAAGQGGAVRVGVTRAGASVIMEISDNGPGMTHEFVSDVYFKPFRSTKEAGMGLGAFQCRTYARELGGDVTVISSPGVGTTVRVVLPVAADSAQQPAATPGKTHAHAAEAHAAEANAAEANAVED